MSGGLDRRGLFRGAAALGGTATLPAAARAQTDAPAEAPAPAPASAPAAAPATTPAAPAPGSLDAWRAGHRAAPDQGPYRFFNPMEAAFVEAAADRLIPADDEWPGALWAGVPAYIDGQLAGAYGQGARFYAAGPWAKGIPSQGYQLPLAPAALYRTSLAALLREGERRQLDFAGATPEQQDGFLQEMEAGKIDCGGFPSSVFFETLLANTIEGFLSDPVYGGNRDMVGWRMIGFPGAYAAYLPLYTHHGMTLAREPMSIGDHARAQQVHGEEGSHRHG